MSRLARVVLPGVPCHVTQRGNGRQQIFFDETDHILYLDLLRGQSADAGLSLWAYCLMPNHVHLVAVPTRPTALAKTLGRTHADFARHFNLQRRSCGHVWQARFFSSPLDDAHLWQAMAYVERNPVRAGMVSDAGQYRWSSAAAHLTGNDPDRMLDLSRWRLEYGPERWKRVLETSVGEEALGERIQEASRRGRALGSEEFVKELEARAGRRLRPHPVGRPKQAVLDDPAQLMLVIGV
jgi:putative transposase